MMPNESRAAARSRVVEFLLVAAQKLQVLPIVKYSALSLFADQFVYSVSDSRKESGKNVDSWLLEPITESSLQIFALVSLWISSKMHDSKAVSAESLKSVGDKMIKDQHFTSRDYIEAEMVFMQVLEFEISMLNTPFAHLEHLLLQFKEIAKIGETTNLEACLDIMDLVHENEKFSSKYFDPRILAASTMIASYLITVPKQMYEFPLLPWVTYITSFTEDDVLKLVGDILNHILSPQ